MRGNSQVTSASLRDSARPLARSSVSSNSRGFMRSGTSPFSMSMANCKADAKSSATNSDKGLGLSHKTLAAILALRHAD